MEGFASAAGLLPEQLWDAPDRPEARLRLGGPTGSAMPLMWAHAEYIKLLRSIHDGQAFDRVPAIVERYATGRRDCALEVWSFKRSVRSICAGAIVRVQASEPFRLHWTSSDWLDVEDTASTETALGISFADVSVASEQAAPLRFTFFWPQDQRWEGRDFVIEVDRR
jgi:glucoamylase